MRFHFAVMSGGFNVTDDVLISRLCAHWNVASVAKLVALGRNWNANPEHSRNHMAAFAEEITSAASEGSELALKVCDHAAHSVAEGIGLVGECFDGQAVPVVLSGSTVQSEVIKTLVVNILAQSKTKRYVVQESDNSPLIGAVLMALQHQGVVAEAIDRERLAHFYLRASNSSSA